MAADPCRLRAANAVQAQCDESACIYWRVAQHLDIAPVESGCAIQHFELLGEEGSELAAWLLSVKERIEAEEARGH